MAPVRVNLLQERVYEEMGKRFELIAQAAHELLAEHLDSAEVVVRDDELSRVVHAYFLMSEAYKADKLGHRDGGDEHWTEGAKKAALTTIAVMLIRPFRIAAPMSPIRDPASAVANQMLALTCAASLMGREWPHLSWEPQRRLFSVLDRIGLPPLRVRCLRDYLQDQSRGIFRSQYVIDIDRDIVLINALILLYEAPLRP